MDETPVVTCFLRNQSEILLVRRSDAVGSYADRWGAVAGHVAERRDSAARPDPDEAARREIGGETGLEDTVTLVRRGEPFPVEDADLDTRWVVYPYLFDCDSRDVTTNDETAAHEWVPPTEILRRETVPGLWTAYDRVRPTVTSVANDREHGSAYISVRALEALRDGAALATERPEDGTDLPALARRLRDARPSMTAVGNRVDRVMASADEHTPVAIEAAAGDAIDAALSADERAGENAAERVAGDRLVTLSRSGTVAAALAAADPDAVLVAESRPGGEGVGVAERLAADGVDVRLAPDAAVAQALAALDGDTDSPGEYDAALVGADTVMPDGSVRNKVGTRALALACAREDVPVYAVAARDKISPERDPVFESVDPATVYDGPADIAVTAPLFDLTSPDLLAGIVTEDGVFDPDDVADIAAEHRDRADWA